MDVFALDEDFNLVAMGIPYDNLQWIRKYYEPGQFAMQIPIGVYDGSWKYIGSQSRPELGMVQRMETAGDDLVLVSGFFCEKMLDRKAVYPRYKGEAASAELAARSIFEAYRKDLPIILGAANQPMLGGAVSSDFSDDRLGTKLFALLEAFELSYRVRYDYVGNRLMFEVWQGVDRSQSQDENSWQVFSLEFGNLKSRSVVTDDSDWYNYAIVPVDAWDDDPEKERETLYVDLTNGGTRRDIVFDMRSSHPSDDQTMAQWRESVRQEATEKLLSYAKVEDIDIEVLGESGYMDDFDLGDRCDAILTDVGISMETRIIQVDEVFKADGGHSVTVGMGNKRISNIRRAVNGA